MKKLIYLEFVALCFTVFFYEAGKVLDLSPGARFGWLFFIGATVFVFREVLDKEERGRGHRIGAVALALFVGAGTTYGNRFLEIHDSHEGTWAALLVLSAAVVWGALHGALLLNRSLSLRAARDKVARDDVDVAILTLYVTALCVFCIGYSAW